MQLDHLTQQIINGYQHNFPLCSEPYKAIAEELNCTEEQVLSRVKLLQEEKVLSRLGPVFNHKKAGASTLAAIAVPPEKLDYVAEQVNSFVQVNHNYAREHRFNLWFVATANHYDALQQCLQDIEKETGYPVLVLPMEASYHIDLGFDVCFDNINSKGN